ncbi:hypothetical protein L226DRAFT_574779 [Lentinus tigrinus ALCF2SS1-7]|uniref:Cupredoxin n=1 Tax=Lentinus tigrinus ALCF2SS1-6 TaxID=1328759 RepID=A0A5C2S4V4_9APHY|nr:hypothetical protein L227DRAFT_613349 [Lentinus tigrinus ALCF2SS1-6]RPD70460.1 hypothetical protein L226DRAFT_574779 [Lentinus tigrinus ALCF2SS1-7]
MARLLALALSLGLIVHFVYAKLIVVTVGGNGTNSVFDPPEVVANIHDTVLFNFTQGKHTATQSTFASPCVPIQDVNSSYIGFSSGFHDTANGSAVTSYQFEVLDNSTLWYFDAATCSQGGVGGINVNDSSWQTLDGFRRNAMRLNGTATSKASSAPRTSTSASTETSAVGTSNSNSAPDRTGASLSGICAVSVSLVIAAVASALF